MTEPPIFTNYRLAQTLRRSKSPQRLHSKWTRITQKFGAVMVSPSCVFTKQERTKMYTVEQIEDMSPEKKREYLEQMAIAHFQTDRWKAAFARSIARQPMTITQWYMGDKSPPTWAILLLQAFANEAKAVMELNQAKAAVDQGIKSLLAIKATFAADETA